MVSLDEVGLALFNVMNRGRCPVISPYIDVIHPLFEISTLDSLSSIGIEQERISKAVEKLHHWLLAFGKPCDCASNAKPTKLINARKRANQNTLQCHSPSTRKGYDPLPCLNSSGRPDPSSTFDISTSTPSHSPRRANRYRTAQYSQR